MSKKTNAVANPAIDGAFLAMMQQHRKGASLTDLSDAIRQVTEAVQLTGRPGSVTFKVSIRPASKGGAMVVEDDISTKLPKSDKEGSIFFADDKHNLLREDPNQAVLPLRSIEGGAGEQKPEALRKVGER